MEYEEVRRPLNHYGWILLLDTAYRKILDGLFICNRHVAFVD